MSYITRDLLSLAVSRSAGEQVILRVKTMEANGDGSYTAYPREIKILARVVDLQPNEIQRLQDRGITLHRGVSVAVAVELDTVPDVIIRSDGTQMKVMAHTMSENGSVFVADIPPLGSAVA